jgi:hypothetical protein
MIAAAEPEDEDELSDMASSDIQRLRDYVEGTDK